MAEVKLGEATTEVAYPETFEYTTKRGFKIKCGKPRGPLKLRLRELLTLEEINDDKELVAIATAFLCVQEVDGEKPKLKTRMQFENMYSQAFADDDDVSGFMNEYQRLSDPEFHEFIEVSSKEALEAGCVTEKEITAFVTKKILERQETNKEKVRL